jgi:hypothetical protein
MATKAKQIQKPSRLLTLIKERLSSLKVKASVSITECGEHVIVFIGNKANQMFKCAVDMVDEIVAFIVAVVGPNMRRIKKQPQPAI